MGKPRQDKADRLDEGSKFSLATEPVDDFELAAAIDRFVEAYVFETKRARVRKDILGRGEKRANALENLPRSIPFASVAHSFRDSFANTYRSPLIGSRFSADCTRTRALRDLASGSRELPQQRVSARR